MITMMKIVKRALLSALFLYSYIPYASAAEIGLTAGYYSITADTGTSESTVANLGAYRFSFSNEITKKVALNVGYNVIFEQIATGDSSFGFDLGIRYFHYGMSSYSSSKIGNINIKVEQDWSPYAGFSFNQRQYQSIRSSYSGFGFTVGTLKKFMSKLKLIFELRYVALAGASTASASELSLQSGINFSY